MGLARSTLERASFFVDQAQAIGLTDRAAFQHFLEAAIVFGRSVTLHLQKEYAHTAGFAGWYAPWQQRLKEYALAGFFLEQRNYVLKEGPLKIGKHVDLHLHATIRLTASVNVKVIRGSPWYRRSMKTLWQDASHPVRNWLFQRRQRRENERQSPPLPDAPPQSTIVETLRCAGAPWNERPALQLLREYLGVLAELVDEAEATFGPGEPEAA